MTKQYWPVTLEIDLAQIRHNVQEIAKKVGENVCIMAVVKSNAYGHDAYKTARAALQAGASKLAVTYLDEAIALRESGITVPILILGPSLEDCATDIVKYEIMQSISELSLVQSLSKEAVRQNKKALVNIKINTGMNRFGVEPHEALDFIKKVQALENIEIEGIFTHLSSSYANIAVTERHFEIFNAVIKDLEAHNIHIPYKHCCNTGGIINFPHMYLNQVRPALLITTSYPAIEPKNTMDLREAMRLKTKLLSIRNVTAGAAIGYNEMFVTDKPAKIAVIAAGWGDGIPRELSNIGEVLIQGIRCPIRGRVMCDHIFADITHLPAEVSVGDEIVVFGQQQDEFLSCWDWAKHMGGVSSPITNRNFITNRVQKIYLNEINV